MMPFRTPSFAGHVRAQRGVALVVVLILLLVMTLLGLASLRGTLLEERMTANLLDRSLSFQAAEAALREAETIAEGLNPATDLPASGCVDGICAAPLATAADRWTVATTWSSAASRVADNVVVDTTPARYIIEWLPRTDATGAVIGTGGWPDTSGECTTSGDVSPDATCDNVSFRYRITARSQVADRAAVVLQSNFVAP